jgi:hypothetical protein
MRFIVSICCYAAILLVPMVGRTAPLNGLVGKGYEHVRSQLLRNGFRAARLKHNSEVDLFCYAGFCKQYPEVLNCAGTGLSPCEFVFVRQNDQRHLIIDTRGEEHLIVTNVHWAHDYEIREVRRHS